MATEDILLYTVDDYLLMYQLEEESKRIAAVDDLPTRAQEDIGNQPNKVSHNQFVMTGNIIKFHRQYINKFVSSCTI